MKIKQFDNDALVAEYVAKQLIETIDKKCNALLCLAAGNSPLACYQYFVQQSHEQKRNLNTVRFVSLDEWIGIEKKLIGSCYQMLHQAIFSPLSIANEQIHFFNAQADDMNRECEIADLYIAKSGPIDCAILGLGMNGHIGFNEPSDTFSTMSHVINLASITQARGRDYFNSSDLDLSRGISLGLTQIMESKNIILIVTGHAKSEAFKQLMAIEPDPQFPASILKRHNNCTIVVDNAAASCL